ncbi:MAG TPA: hypothetical protein VF765_00755 [Polyangiaceae bacterium]
MPDLLHVPIPPHVPPEGEPADSPFTFGIRSILLPERIAFPHAPMEPALAEHARLLRAWGPEMPRGVTEPEFVAIHAPDHGVRNFTAVVVADDHGRSDMRVWTRQDASWVVRRCRGIVRQLIEEPDWGRFYAVVVAHGVASLHVMRITGAPPGRLVGHSGGTLEGLGVKPVGPALVAEPWEQWHRRFLARGVFTTWWEMPDGSRGQADARMATRPRTLREDVERTFAACRDRVEREIAWHDSHANGRKPPRFVALHSDHKEGNRVYVMPHYAWEFVARRRVPRLRSALRRPVEGFDAACVLLDRGGGVLWLPRGRARDVAAPRPVFELRTDCEN